MKCVNPTTEEGSEYPETAATALPQIFAALEESFSKWSSVDLGERVRLCALAIKEIELAKERFARTISEEMGKPIRLSRLEIDRGVEECRCNLDNAVTWLATEKVIQGYVRHDPLGVVAIISPWNFPLMLPLRGIVPALLAGNSVLFKPSELSLKTAELLVSMFDKHLAPSPLIAVYGDKSLGAAVVDLPVSAIAFTGSTAVGKSIAAQSAQSLKKLTLELGGLDAALVLDDADLDVAAKDLVISNTGNSGQVCNAVKRVFVSRVRYERFVQLVVERVKSLIVGDPLDEATELGPLVSKTQLERVESFVEDARKRGAKILTGGKRMSRKGYFFEPTVMVDVPSDALLLHEEPFGPVLPILSFDSVDDAIQLANGTRYGLTASIWTGDQSRAEQLAEKLQVGTVGINIHRAGPPGTPWGGTKESGLGRMKTCEGMREFTNTKLVRMRA